MHGNLNIEGMTEELILFEWIINKRLYNGDKVNNKNAVVLTVFNEAKSVC